MLSELIHSADILLNEDLVDSDNLSDEDPDESFREEQIIEESPKSEVSRLSYDTIFLDSFLEEETKIDIESCFDNYCSQWKKKYIQYKHYIDFAQMVDRDLRLLQRMMDLRQKNSIVRVNLPDIENYERNYIFEQNAFANAILLCLPIVFTEENYSIKPVMDLLGSEKIFSGLIAIERKGSTKRDWIDLSLVYKTHFSSFATLRANTASDMDVLFACLYRGLRINPWDNPWDISDSFYPEVAQKLGISVESLEDVFCCKEFEYRFPEIGVTLQQVKDAIQSL